jgi:hypothetical protein
MEFFPKKRRYEVLYRLEGTVSLVTPVEIRQITPRCIRRVLQPHLRLLKINQGGLARSAILCHQATNRPDGRKALPAGRNLHLVAALRLAATTAGISPRSGPDDSLFDFSFER